MQSATVKLRRCLGVGATFLESKRHVQATRRRNVWETLKGAYLIMSRQKAGTHPLDIA